MNAKKCKKLRRKFRKIGLPGTLVGRDKVTGESLNIAKRAWRVLKAES